MKILLSILFISSIYAQSLEIDRELIIDSEKTLKWATIPIISQGQMYNNKYLKSIFFYSAQSYCLNMAIKYNDMDPSYSNLRKRNDFVWWLVGFYVSSIIDAYVDAELSSFPERIF